MGANGGPNGTVTVTGASTISGATAERIYYGEVVNLKGATTWTSATGGDIAIYSAGQGTTTGNIASGASFTDQGTTATTGTRYLGYYADGVINNAGTYTRTGLGTTQIDAAFNNTGELQISSGTIQVQGPTFTNKGTINFGLSSLTSFGKLVATGAVTLQGQVSVDLLGGYAPTVGSIFQVMTFGSETGTFANTSWTFDGVTFKPIYNANNFELEVGSIGAVPEPTNTALMLGGPAVLGYIARNRRRLADRTKSVRTRHGE